MSGIKAKISNAVDKLTHKSDRSSTTSSLADRDENLASHGVSPTQSFQSSAPTTAGALDSPAHTHERGMTTSTAATGAVGGIDGYQHANPTGIDSAGYNKVSETQMPMTSTTRDGVISESEIIDSKTFTKTVDHEVLIEKKEYILEHRPVQETYVVETRKIGEGRVPGRATEIVGREANEVDHKEVAMPRGERTVIVQDVDVPLEDLHISGREVNATSTREVPMGAKREMGAIERDVNIAREV